MCSADREADTFFCFAALLGVVHDVFIRESDDATQVIVFFWNCARNIRGALTLLRMVMLSWCAHECMCHSLLLSL